MVADRQYCVLAQCLSLPAAAAAVAGLTVVLEEVQVVLLQTVAEVPKPDQEREEAVGGEVVILVAAQMVEMALRNVLLISMGDSDMDLADTESLIAETAAPALAAEDITAAVPEEETQADMAVVEAPATSAE